MKPLIWLGLQVVSYNLEKRAIRMKYSSSLNDAEFSAWPSLKSTAVSSLQIRIRIFEICIQKSGDG